MMSEQQAEQLELDFDPSFMEKWLRFQKFALTFLCLMLAVGLTGILGRGPFGKQHISAGPGQLGITYERVLHYKTPSVIEVRLPQLALSTGNRIRLYLRGAFVRNAPLQRILPQPMYAVPLPDAVLAQLPVTPGSSGGTILIFQEPSGLGTLTSTIALDGGASIQFKQFIIP
jgi:hypothetical protein